MFHTVSFWRLLVIANFLLEFVLPTAISTSVALKMQTAFEYVSIMQETLRLSDTMLRKKAIKNFIQYFRNVYCDNRDMLTNIL